ncbi:hypothetical protein BPO_0650 [Bergeyella porcorum]|uniref:Uncharacterized protein n=2 Tax=Bergeyella porcorum TaxID=1735111 RepID=A0AAU0F0M8_9FLAO
MMKKILLLMSLVSSVAAFAQCTIVGEEILEVNRSVTFSIENDNAQCPDCHLWRAKGDNLRIQGDFRKGKVSVTPLAVGKNELTLTILTAQGVSQCSKNIDVLEKVAMAATPPLEYNKMDCDINISDFKEIKYSEGIVSFFPNNTDNNFRYQWAVTHASGEMVTSYEKVPKFQYNKEAGITSAKLRVISGRCIRDLSKTYDVGFWKFF